MSECSECICADCRKQDRCNICLECCKSSSDSSKKECPKGAYEEEGSVEDPDYGYEY